MIDALQNEDRMSIVTFDDNIRTDLPLTLLNSAGKNNSEHSYRQNNTR